MKHIKYVIIGFIGIVLFACGNEAEKDSGVSREVLKKSISEMEDSIRTLQKNAGAMAIPSLTNIELINRLTLYYRYYPIDPYSADCLFKVHIKYSDLGAYQKSVDYGDTILREFPDFKNRDFIMESIASSYDVFISPRDTAQVRKYYTMLLNEANVPSRKKGDIRKRLAHLDLSLFEYAEYNMKTSAKK